MIRLEHINLVVEDIPRALRFYQAALPHWKIRGEGRAPWYDKMRTWIHFGDDYQYITFNDNGEGGNRDLTKHRSGLAHFAFIVDNMEAVIQRLQQAGFAIASNGANHPFINNVYFIDPDGFEVEFVEYRSDIPAERNLYC
ncbi:Metallothiol transferase FosB [Thalassocella blandensis]|nr:Metallothiol transferase FosB [Thalassocella blandensis]